ncbi:MAG: hypothetical protein ABSF44_12190, partial [Candidatus Bathyarchaeia archaeon]
MKKTQVIVLAFFILLSFSMIVSSIQVKGQIATIWTDKPDYHPGDVVTIYGTGFMSNADVAINVTKQADGSVSSFNVISDSNGNFTATYQIDNFGAPLFDVTATDGMNIATTTFTDSVLALDNSGSSSSTSSATVTVSSLNCKVNDVVIVLASSYSSNTISSVSGGSLTWTPARANVDQSSHDRIWEFYAVPTSSALTSVTVTFGSSDSSGLNVVVFGISGANAASPFDGSARTASAGSGAPTVTGVSTSTAADMIIGLEGHRSTVDATAGSIAGTTGTLIKAQHAGSSGTAAEYRIVSGTLSSQSVAFGTVSTSDWAMIVEAIKPALPLSVSVSPSSWTMDVGQSETFTATPAGGSGSYTGYQWYVGGVAQSGQTASTFSYSPSSAGSPLITVTVTDSSSTTSPQSSAPSVTVNAAQTVSVTPTSVTMDVGQSQTFTCAASGGSGTLHYQWYLAGSAVSGQTGTTYVYVGSAGSPSIYCRVTDSASTPFMVQSNTPSVTVNAAQIVAVTPTPVTMDVGQSQVFSCVASGGSGTLSYQWYLAGSAVSGQTGTTYVYTPSSAGSATIYCRVTDSASTPFMVQSNTPSVTVAASPTV